MKANVRIVNSIWDRKRRAENIFLFISFAVQSDGLGQAKNKRNTL